MKHDIGIVTDSVCDLPAQFIRENDIGIIYFYIIVGSGRFRDGDEISSNNIIELYASGKTKVLSDVPSVDEYTEYFTKALKKYKQIVYICLSSGMSSAYDHASSALKNMGEMSERILLVDSKSLSTGMGHLVMRAEELRRSGKTAGEIRDDIVNMRKRVSTSFISSDPEYLCMNGKISQPITKLIKFLHVHAVFALKDGKPYAETLWFGNRKSATRNYIRHFLGNGDNIDKKRLFLTHAGCRPEYIKELLVDIRKRVPFEEIIVTQASAAVTGNCGEGTIGLLFVRKE
ncbi:MAG: DegV family protein [Clostridiales bacterium]|nr:DegV family protein [Clostridiales bacterium]